MTDYVIGSPSFFNEDSKFFRDVYIYGKLHYDFKQNDPIEFNNVIIRGTLDVYGKSNFYDDVYLHKNLSVGILTVRTRLDVGIGGTVIKASTDTGKVGIGSTAPIQKLDVVGNALFTGNIGIGATTIPEQRLDIGGSVKIDKNIYDSVNVPGKNGYELVRDERGIRWIPLISDPLPGVPGIPEEGIFILNEFTPLDAPGNRETYSTYATYATNAGIATYATSSGIATYATSSGIATYATNAGIATYATSSGIATYATSAGIATALQYSRTFGITGNFITAPSISFNGTENVSLAATITTDSIVLGTYTSGDYVKNISGTTNQITVTGGTGEGSTPTLSLPNNLVLPQDVTVTRDLQVNRNLSINGTVTIGGTSATIFSQELKVGDPDIVLGFRTDGSGNDISTDNTANHGGVALASTEGSPLVQLFIAGIETNPATYKKIMWFKKDSFTGLGTDAWLINYAVGIGSTQFPTGTRLAAGNVQFTENDLSVVRNINASGIITAAGQFQSTQANSTTTGAGQIYLNGATGNRIDFNMNGVAAPAFTTRSVGTKIVLYPSLNASAVDYAFGIDNSTLWYSIPDTNHQFKWYAGTTNIATLSGTGNLTIGGAVSGSTATPTNINLGLNYSNGSTRDKCKIFLYNDSGIEQYGFGVGGSGDIQYHSNATHDFYINNGAAARINSSANLLIGATSDTGTASQKLQVTGGAYVSGSLGIGTASPAEKLHIHSDLAVIRLSGSAASQTPFNIRQGIVGTSNAGFSIYDVNNSATRFAIDPSGNIGIGTNSPSSVLDVASSNSGITLTNTGASNKKWRLGGSSAGSFVITETGVADRLTINSSGSIAISGNGSTLYGPNSTWAEYLRVGGNGNADTTNASVVTTNGNLHLDAKTGAFGTYINYYKGTGGIKFGNGAGDIVGSIDSSGNLGLGVASPTQKLDVRGNFLLASDPTTSYHITQKHYTTNSGTLSWEGSAGQLFSITNNLTSGSIFSVNDVSGIPSIDVNANGTVLVAPYGGNLGVGTISPTAKLHVSGDAKINDITVGKGSGTNTTGAPNTAVGYQALISNANGYNSTAVGYLALTTSTAGYDNTVVGSEALRYNTTGFSNTATGTRALHSNTIGRGNTAVGSYALYVNTTGIYNTANGQRALYFNTTGTRNTATGCDALSNNTTGIYNTANGYQALVSNTTGGANTATGDVALSSNTTGVNNTADGRASLQANTTGSANTANGLNSLYSNTTGERNTATGVGTLLFNTTGIYNTANGYQALVSNTTGTSNTAIGYLAGSANTTGGNNTFLGSNAVNTAGGATASNTIVLGDSSVTTLRCQTATISALSDARDKKDVINIPLGLDFLNDLRPVKFTWNQRDRGRIDLPDSGFIAQEALETVMNYDADWFGLVDHQNPEHFELSPAKLIPVLVKAVQELSHQNQELKVRIDSIDEKT